MTELERLRGLERLLRKWDEAELRYSNAEYIYNTSYDPAATRIALEIDRLETERNKARAALHAALVGGK